MIKSDIRTLKFCRSEIPNTRFYWKQYKRLPHRIQEEVKAVFEELLTGSLSIGRRPKKFRSQDNNNQFELRLNLQYRLIVEVFKMCCNNEQYSFMPISVGSHEIVDT